MAALDVTFLNNVTREHFIPGLRNQIYDKTVLMNRIMAGGRVKDAVGRSLIGDVISTKHASLGIYSGYDVLANQPVNPTAQYALSYSNYYATLAISGDEERRNSGAKEKLLDMLKIQTDNAYASLRDLMSTDLYSDGTAIAGRNRIVGLASVVDNDNTYANINRSTAGNEYWKGQVDATSYAFADLNDPTSASYLPKLMRTSEMAATRDNAPDLIVTTTGIYTMYQDIAGVQNLRIDDTMANLGFGGVKFGPTSMAFDRYVTTAYMYFLTTQNFEWYVFPGANFDMIEPGWKQAQNQDAKLAHLIWSGQLVCRVPRENAVLRSLATS